MLLVVRGDKHEADPTYRCVSGDSKKNQFALVEISDNGDVSRKMSLPASAKKDVEHLMNKYRSVYVNDPSNSLKLPKHAQPAGDLVFQIRRSKNQDEKQGLRDIMEATRRTMSENTEPAFRSVAKKSGKKCFYHEENAGDAVLLRAGLQTSDGLCSDVTATVAKSDHVNAMLGRLYKGLEKMQSHVQVGQSFDNLQHLIESELAPDERIVGSPFTHIGYERVDPISTRGDVLQEHDVVNVNVEVKDKRGQRVTMHGGLLSFDDPKTEYRAATDDKTVIFTLPKWFTGSAPGEKKIGEYTFKYKEAETIDKNTVVPVFYNLLQVPLSYSTLKSQTMTAPPPMKTGTNTYTFTRTGDVLTAQTPKNLFMCKSLCREDTFVVEHNGNQETLYNYKIVKGLTAERNKQLQAFHRKIAETLCAAMPNGSLSKECDDDNTTPATPAAATPAAATPDDDVFDVLIDEQVQKRKRDELINVLREYITQAKEASKSLDYRKDIGILDKDAIMETINKSIEDLEATYTALTSDKPYTSRMIDETINFIQNNLSQSKVILQQQLDPKDPNLAKAFDVFGMEASSLRTMLEARSEHMSIFHKFMNDLNKLKY